MEILKVENLSFAFPGALQPVLHDVSFRMEAGDFLALIGATGSGKSTLMRLLKRELAPIGSMQGCVYYNGVAQQELLERVSACEIGYVMQRPEQQIVTDKVWHELAFGLENLGLPQSVIRRRVAEMASYFGISDWFERDVSELSGGQKQLLNLAAVMVMQPKILLLDEPTSQLDPIAAADFLNTVSKLNREMGVGVILIEHRLESVLPMADRVLVLEDGTLQLDLPPAQACERLRSHPVLLDAMPGAVRLFHAVNGAGDCPITVREGRRLLREHFGNDVRSLPEATASRSDETVLEFKNVYFRYGREYPDVLKGLNLQVRKGEIFCFLGSNGSGKSTLLKLCAGLCRPYSGSIRIFGKKIQQFRGQSLYRDCVALLPQDPQTVFLKSTVRDELHEVHADPSALPYSLVHLMERHPYDLSGGEQQLVALAKVLASRPQILLLDEPTKGVDSHAQTAVLEVLQRLKAEGITILLVTHDVEFAARCADRCALFFRGEIVSEDAPARFFDENSFYTTSANRICRGWYEGVATVENAAELCRRNGGAR
ncbi:MAG: ATP-binding cassette domain-containing protein [Clostridia bacterium]|nr:ATP-binding cassette domain-containing protein [Clostridia bacterium]